MKYSYDKLFELHASNLLEIKELKNNIDKNIQEKADQFREFILNIIEVIDTYENAELVIIEHELNKEETGKKIMSRYNSVMSKLIKILSKHGIKKIEFPDNKVIIGFCKVLETLPDPEKENDTILEIVKNGYHRGKELIREAEVIIVKN